MKGFIRKTLHHNANDLTGMRFGRLNVLGAGAQERPHRTYWHCRCDCGKDANVCGGYLTAGDTKSCGCLAIEAMDRGRRKHGQSDTRTFSIWSNMLKRCRNEKTPAYRWYGARGIKVCERWLSFENFLADMGHAPAGLSIDRYPNNDGNYEPGNCRWADAKSQVMNSRRIRWITWSGETLSLSDWARRLGVSAATLSRRLGSWPVDTAMTAGAGRQEKSP